MESQSLKKCLKVVVFVCKVIPSVQVYLINECETELYWIIGQDYCWNYLRPALPILYRNTVLCLALSRCRNRFLSAGVTFCLLLFLRCQIYNSLLMQSCTAMGRHMQHSVFHRAYCRISHIFMSRIFSVPNLTQQNQVTEEQNGLSWNEKNANKYWI